jgi:hypothetical protein
MVNLVITFNFGIKILSITLPDCELGFKGHLQFDMELTNPIIIVPRQLWHKLNYFLICWNFERNT